MGSIIIYDAECPKCKKDTGHLDSYYKSGEEYFTCQNKECQFGYNYEWKRDDNHQLVTKDGTENHKFDNLTMIETVWENGIETSKELV